MNAEIIQKKILNILGIVPPIKEIFLSRDPIDEKRKKLRNVLAEIITATFEDDPAIPPLEWIMTRDAVSVFRNILSTRNERLAGYSLLRYIDDLLQPGRNKDLPKPSSGFFAELEHMFRGVAGKSGIYSDKVPSFLTQHGKKAARLRSTDLSRMSRFADHFMKRYPCGLQDEVIRRRIKNKMRILSYFGATEIEWEKWRWHTRHIIRDADTLNALIQLTDDEYEAVNLARKNKIPFGITPYYLSLLDYESHRKNDYATRAQVIPPLHYVNKLIELKMRNEKAIDFMLEQDTSPIEGITRRYPKIVILKPILTCPQICVYCQRNWEIEDVYSPHATMTKDKLKKAIRWIRKTPEINEVLITGGDPLILSDQKIEELLRELSEINHIERIRIGTRTPVTLPQRITDSMMRRINRFQNPGRRELMIVTHFENPYEITPQAMKSIQRFQRYGMKVYNQLVYTFYNSRKFEAAFLRHKLNLIGVTPYYTFNTKGKEETDDYRVPIARLLQEQHEEARLMPGTVRTDEIVFNVPRLGKNYLRAFQHHDIISILPDGRRMYEFHPWEKKLSLVDTYVYRDVSIYDYLERLKAAGENKADYKTIWYYY